MREPGKGMSEEEFWQGLLVALSIAVLLAWLALSKTPGYERLKEVFLG